MSESRKRSVDTCNPDMNVEQNTPVLTRSIVHVNKRSVDEGSLCVNGRWHALALTVFTTGRTSYVSSHVLFKVRTSNDILRPHSSSDLIHQDANEQYNKSLRQFQCSHKPNSDHLACISSEILFRNFVVQRQSTAKSSGGESRLLTPASRGCANQSRIRPMLSSEEVQQTVYQLYSDSTVPQRSIERSYHMMISSWDLYLRTSCTRMTSL